MKQINLLPWRQRAREEKIKVFTEWMYVSALIGMGLACTVWFYAKNREADVLEGIAKLQSELRICNQKVVQIAKYKELKDVLVARMRVVQNLQSTRALTVHLFDELTSIVPEGIYLTQVSRVGDMVTLMGSSDSNISISMLMHNIAANRWISQPELKEIKRAAEKKTSTTSAEIPSRVGDKFELRFTLKANKIEEKGPHGAK